MRITRRVFSASTTTMLLPSVLILAVAVALLSPSALAEEWLECDPPKSFQVELDNGEKVQIYDAEIKVKYDRSDLAVYEYPDLADVNLLINNTVVTFSGHVLPEFVELDPFVPKLTRTFKSQIAGDARLIRKQQSSDFSLTDCNLYLSRNRNEEEASIPKKAQVEIIHEAATCVKATICQRIGAVRPEDMRRARDHPFNFGRLAIFSRRRDNSVENTFYRTGDGSEEAASGIDASDVRLLLANYRDEPNGISRDLQSTINKLVDLAIAELVKKIDEENHGKITIPNVSQNFSTGSSWWETTGEFNTFEGTFEDLTTLKRTEDAGLSHTGLKFVASCGVGLSTANMEYQKYKLRYGIVKVNGKVSGSIDGLAVSAAAGIDYNQKPCRTVLEDLRVSELGKIKVKLTGLGPLNKLLSKLVTWITKKWQEEIVELVEGKLRDLIVKNLDKFDCEKYRP